MITTDAFELSPSALTTQATRTVFIPKPAGMTPADAMTHIREWLDRRKLQSSKFDIIGETGFSLRFSSVDADEFQHFEWPVT